jgi:hypothetical protein
MFSNALPNLLALFLVAWLAAPPPAADPDALAREAAKLPNHGSLKLDVAMALARAGRTAEALQWLGRAAEMGIGADLAALESAFGAAARTPAFAAIRRRFDDNVAPRARGEVAFTLSERDLYPESVAYDPGHKTFYVGGMYRRKIVKVDAGGRVSDFVTPGRDGLFSVLGMKVDVARRELWANACNLGRGPAMANPEPETVGRAAVFRYDLDTGRLIRRYDGPAEPRPLCFNDLDLTASGDVYVSAGGSGLYRVDRGRDVLELFVPASELLVNGLALSADGRKLYLAAHARGVVSLDLATRQWKPLSVPEDATLNGIDGLYVYRQGLVGVQNALRHGPARVVQAFLDASGERVTCVATLDRNHPLHDIPTTGVVVGEALYYVATSQLASFEADGSPLPMARLKDNVVLKVPLLDRCPNAAADGTAELLALHARGREAHFRTDVDLLLADAGEEFISVSGGRISRITPAEQRAFFAGYFKGATYQEWDDVEPPIVRVSDDGSMGWVITRVRVRRTQKDATGAGKEASFVYAGIMTYEKRDGRWVRVANVSTFE